MMPPVAPTSLCQCIQLREDAIQSARAHGERSARRRNRLELAKMFLVALACALTLGAFSHLF